MANSNLGTGQIGPLPTTAPRSPITTAKSVIVKEGEKYIKVSIYVNSFNKVGAVSLTLKYDEKVLAEPTFEDIKYPKLMVVSPTRGVIRAGGFTNAGEGVTLPDKSILFTINFLYLGGTTELKWDDEDGSSCEYADDTQDFIPFKDRPMSTYYINGKVSSMPKQSGGGNATFTIGPKN